MKFGFNKLANGLPDNQKFTDAELVDMGWPADFDFENDIFCQRDMIPYINECLTEFEEYDEKRDLKSDYIFHQHMVDAADDVAQTALQLGLGEKVAANLYYATLLHDIGKMDLEHEIWDYEDSPPAAIKQKKRTHVHLGVIQIEEHFKGIKHPFLDLAKDVIENHHKQLNQLKEGDTLSNPARLVAIVEDYDGRSHLRSHHIKMGLTNDIPSILARQEEKCEGWFDPQLYQAFKEIKLQQHAQRSQPTLQPHSPEQI